MYSRTSSVMNNFTNDIIQNNPNSAALSRAKTHQGAEIQIPGAKDKMGTK
jgi:hypothetical protein